MSDSGFIYILSNEAMPGLLKIGKTARHPDERAKEIDGTGVALPFRLEFAMYCPVHLSAQEASIHRRLESCRVRKSREFFRLDTHNALIAVTQAYLDCHGLAVCHYEDSIIRHEDAVRVCQRLMDITGDEGMAGLAADLFSHITPEEIVTLEKRRINSLYPEWISDPNRIAELLKKLDRRPREEQETATVTL